MDKMVAIQVFRRVVELNGFSLAAEDLGLSNAAISKNIRELEKELGARLINRTTRRLSLTETGQIYFQRISHILDELENAEEAVTNMAAKPRGLLRITMPFSFGLTHIAEAVFQFLAVYPEIRVEMVMNDRYVDLVEEGFDVGIRGGKRPKDQSLISCEIYTLDRVVCASPDYLSQYGEPISPMELEQHKCIIYSLSSSPNQWHFQNEGQKILVNVDGPVHVNNSLAVKQAAVAGLGIIYAPMFAVCEELEVGTLKAILKDWPSEPQALYAIYPKHHQLSQKLQAFVGFISDYF